MPRALDLDALRSFVTIAEVGGVTRAAARLSLTQSAVSMQIKRLEALLGQPLLDRASRGVTLTTHGEQLLSYARRMLALNDEAMARMTGEEWEGALVMGVPHDAVYPHIPAVLSQFARSHPRVRVSLISSVTALLKAQFARGAADLILTTERGVEPGGETLTESPLIWVGAQDGKAWRNRPLPLAFEYRCMFRPIAQRALEAAGIDWVMAVEGDSTRTIEASVSADLGVAAILDSAAPPYLARIAHDGALPPLPSVSINLYQARGPKAALTARLADAVRKAYRGRGAALAAE